MRMIQTQNMFYQRIVTSIINEDYYNDPSDAVVNAFLTQDSLSDIQQFRKSVQRLINSDPSISKKIIESRI